MTTFGPKTSITAYPNPYNPSYRVFYAARKGYTQKPRTDDPLPVTIFKAEFARPDLWNSSCDAPNCMIAYRTQYPATSYPGSPPGQYGGRESTEALNTCYAKFKDKVYSASASLGVNVAERKQLVDTIVKDANFLRKGWNYLRRGQLGRFKEHFGIKSRKGDSPWSRPEMAGSLWLQYHFGWDPLVKDLYETVKILESEYPYQKIRTRAAKRGSYKADNNYGGWNYDVPEFSYRVEMQAGVRVKNLNLHRATSLGLTNPALLLWEVVPFSFVVDWFWPIGEFLESWTDFVGLEFKGAYTTRSNRARGDQYQRALLSYGGYIIEASAQRKCYARYLNRSLGILGPAFPYPKQFKGFSVVRGATAIALLVGALSSERRYFAQTARG